MVIGMTAKFDRTIWDVLEISVGKISFLGNKSRMLEVVVLFLLSSVSYFVAHLERPTSFWGHFRAACPIIMGLLSAEIVYINVGFSLSINILVYLHFIIFRNR
ncbi:uncharacterized protein LOC108107082 [Drosophila eugracilis]|uniref:uncharacterized protein LOC108107082 n=1 Tax=Drosophila eugracilis TaxID=29029 RepID=UPI001BD925CA|nr:uncharacterized protein LOC108107082 [Drosophila eugracilis]